LVHINALSVYTGAVGALACNVCFGAVFVRALSGGYHVAVREVNP